MIYIKAIYSDKNGKEITNDHFFPIKITLPNENMETKMKAKTLKVNVSKFMKQKAHDPVVKLRVVVSKDGYYFMFKNNAAAKSLIKHLVDKLEGE